MNHIFKKQFGQNFLKSTALRDLIINTAQLSEDDIVIEIGPGQGFLTDLIIRKVKKIILVEIDDELAVHLKEKYKKFKNIKIMNNDILKIEIKKLSLKKYKLIGSLPYNISKKIIRHFLLSNSKPVSMTFVIQKEVAKKYTQIAPDATFLSNFVSIYSNLKYIKSISSKDFYPKPKVDGALIHISNIKNKYINHNELVKFIKIGFSNPRKTLSNNLKNNKFNKDMIEKILKSLNLSDKARPSELNLDQWSRLYKHLNNV